MKAIGIAGDRQKEETKKSCEAGGMEKNCNGI